MAYIMAKNVKIILDRLVSQAREIERLTEPLKQVRTHRDDYYRWWQDEVKEKDAANSEIKDLQGHLQALQDACIAAGMDTAEYAELKALL